MLKQSSRSRQLFQRNLPRAKRLQQSSFEGSKIISRNSPILISEISFLSFGKVQRFCFHFASIVREPEKICTEKTLKEAETNWINRERKREREGIQFFSDLEATLHKGRPTFRLVTKNYIRSLKRGDDDDALREVKRRLLPEALSTLWMGGEPRFSFRRIGGRTEDDGCFVLNSAWNNITRSNW